MSVADRSHVRVLIAASGSGGHLLPAIWIASALKEQALKRGYQIEIEFVGTGRPLEAKIVDGAGYKRHIIQTVGLVGRGIKGILQFIATLPLAIFQTIKIIRNFNPELVIGVGGYATVLPITIAAFFAKKTWIHEAELHPGLANRFLSLVANRISCGFKETKLWSKRTVYTGHPLRADINQVLSRKPGAEIRNLLVLGGSQGARSLDLALKAKSSELKSLGLKVVHQTRPENLSELKATYQAAQIEHQVVNYITDMPKAYSESDIIISRSGAASIAEIARIGRPAILVPLPTSQADHQRINALFLVKAGKALLVEEGEEFESRLIEALKEIVNPDRYKELETAVLQLPENEAAAQIADLSLKLVRP